MSICFSAKALSFVFFVLYWAWPWDLIWDGFAIVGVLDEGILAMALMIWLSRCNRAKQVNNKVAEVSALHRSYYKALGLEPNATEKELRLAFKRLAKQYHPDFLAAQGELQKHEKHEQMLLISKAYQELKKAA